MKRFAHAIGHRGIGVFLLLAMLFGVLPAGIGMAAQPVRIAAYNIKLFTPHVEGPRLEKIAAVIKSTKADVFGLEEIDNREALEKVFDKKEWYIIIDDKALPPAEGERNQNLALAIRKSRFDLVDFSEADLRAADKDFLFPDPADDEIFRARRDVLKVRVRLKNSGQPPVELVFLVHHGKSRIGGRATTDPVRAEAARRMAAKIRADFAGQNVILLGDFNDNPDDRSLQILATGDPIAPPGPRPSSQSATQPASPPLLINLMEPLLAGDHVSIDLNSKAIDKAAQTVNTVRPGSRKKNNDLREEDKDCGPMLADQILISPQLEKCYVPKSAGFSNDPEAVIGNEKNRASDHVPVYADFMFPGEAPK